MAHARTCTHSQVWPGHRLVCGPERAGPYSPPRLTSEEVAYLTSLAEIPRPEQMDHYAKALWTCWRKCLAMRPDSEKATMIWGRTLELLAGAKAGSWTKVGREEPPFPGRELAPFASLTRSQIPVFVVRLRPAARQGGRGTGHGA